VQIFHDYQIMDTNRPLFAVIPLNGLRAAG